jgi:hypothetical protein
MTLGSPGSARVRLLEKCKGESGLEEGGSEIGVATHSAVGAAERDG